MDSRALYNAMVGNDLMLPQRSLSIPVVAAVSPATVIAVHIPHHETKSRFGSIRSLGQFIWRPFSKIVHGHRSLLVFLILLAAVIASATLLGLQYWSNRINLTTANSHPIHYVSKLPTHGFNTMVPEDQLASTLAKITAQSISINTGTQTVPISQTAISSWLQVANDHKHKIAYIHVNEVSIKSALAKTLSSYNKAPLNQVTITHPDGSSSIVVAGRNGVQMGDPVPLSDQIGKNLLASKGMQFNLPSQTVPFQSVTQAAFAKLIEVNVVTKQMYLYDNGNLTRSYPISAGAPSTPTPLGEFKIYSKLPVEDMRGFNANGTKYFQPHVHWINYFLPGGYAVHGNYWRPLSWFGAINSSHGCVSLPDDQAEWVYSWAPIGTTVITHT